jgi:RNA polymerase-binding protein DksA
MSTIDTDRIRERLHAERERVAAALAYLERENPGSLEEETGELTAADSNHMGDVATQTYDREMDYSLAENDEHVLRAIDAALARVDDGTYGICRTCGNRIDEGRLEARPWADQCIDCRRREERG